MQIVPLIDPFALHQDGKDDLTGDWVISTNSITLTAGTLTAAAGVFVSESMPQLQIKYDATKYADIGVGSSGNFLIAAAGAGEIYLIDDVHLDYAGAYTHKLIFDVDGDSFLYSQTDSDDTLQIYLGGSSEYRFTTDFFELGGNDIKPIGALGIVTAGDPDDYLTFQTVNNVPTIATIGACDLKITSSSGEIDFDNENLTTSGNIGGADITASGVFEASDGAVGAPAFSFTSDPDTGIYTSLAGKINFALGGVEALSLGGAGFTCYVPFFQFNRYSNITSLGPQMRFFRAKGTRAAPLAVTSGNLLFQIDVQGYNSSTYHGGASIKTYANENFDATHGGSRMEFYTTADVATSDTKRVTIGADGNVVFGGDVDVTGVYKVDGTQVVSNQQAHIADAPGDTTANNATTINAILTALETHGLLAAA